MDPNRPSRRLYDKLARLARLLYYKVVRQAGTPEQIALGMSVGVMAGMVVPPCFQVFVVLGISLLFTFNRAAGLLGTMVTNPLTYVPVYAFEVALGKWITGVDLGGWQMPSTFEAVWQLVVDLFTNWDRVGHVVIAFLVGATISGIVLTIPAYYVTRWAVVAFRQQRALRTEKRRLKRERREAELAALKGAVPLTPPPTPPVPPAPPPLPEPPEPPP